MGLSLSLPESTRPTRTRSRSRSRPFPTRSTSTRSTAMIHPTALVDPTPLPDATSSIPDDCLAIIFQSLPSSDRTTCSSVCKRWLLVEGQSRHRLSLNATSDIFPILPSLFSRFDSVTKLALRCDRRSISLSDDALVLISRYCRNLTRLKLRGCRELTDFGIAAFAENCRSLRKLSCGSCVFGAAGINAVLRHCAALEEISVKRLRGINDDNNTNTNTFDDNNGGQVGITPGVAALSLKTICLKELYNGQLFSSLIVGAKNLRSLKLIRCLGDWDNVVESLAGSINNTSLVEIHLERIQMTDVGLTALSRCVKLEVLHLVKVPDCTNLGIVSVAERCKLLRKVHIDGWRTNRIGDEGLCALGKNCINLQELVLIGINPTPLSLEIIATNCKRLERLALCSSETIDDVAMSCIASKCVALKKFCIKSCPISDSGMEALGWGCPNMVKIKVKKCKSVTKEIVEWLRVTRKSLVVILDAGVTEGADASASDGGVGQEDGVELGAVEAEVTPVLAPVRSIGRVSVLRNLAACALRRWSSSGGGNTSADQ